MKDLCAPADPLGRVSFLGYDWPGTKIALACVNTEGATNGRRFR
jgi:hypothetical protein